MVRAVVNKVGNTIRESYRADTFAGNGSTNTKIPYLNSIRTNTISELGTIINDSTNGWSFTASEKVKVDLSVSMASQSAGGSGEQFLGISLNSTELTTNIQSILASARISMTSDGIASGPARDNIIAVATVIMDASDVIRPHSIGQAPFSDRMTLNLTVTRIIE